MNKFFLFMRFYMLIGFPITIFSMQSEDISEAAGTMKFELSEASDTKNMTPFGVTITSRSDELGTKYVVSPSNPSLKMVKIRAQREMAKIGSIEPSEGSYKEHVGVLVIALWDLFNLVRDVNRQQGCIVYDAVTEYSSLEKAVFNFASACGVVNIPYFLPDKNNLLWVHKECKSGLDIVIV